MKRMNSSELTMFLLENAHNPLNVKGMSRMIEINQLITNLFIIVDLLAVIQDKLIYIACFHVLTWQGDSPSHSFSWIDQLYDSVDQIPVVAAG